MTTYQILKGKISRYHVLSFCKVQVVALYLLCPFLSSFLYYLINFFFLKIHLSILHLLATDLFIALTVLGTQGIVASAFWKLEAMNPIIT